jgi:hypothetical protein
MEGWKGWAIHIVAGRMCIGEVCGDRLDEDVWRVDSLDLTGMVCTCSHMHTCTGLHGSLALTLTN